MRPPFAALLVCLTATAAFVTNASASAAATVNDAKIGTVPGSFAYAGSWSTSTGAAGKYQGDDHYSSTTASSYTFRFYGQQAALYGAMAPHHGQGSVRIDGGTAVTIDQYAGARQDNVLLYVTPLLARGSHRVTVTVKGTHHPASTGNTITIDRADSFDRDLSDPMTPTPCSDAVLEAAEPPMLAVPSTTPLSLCVGYPCHCGADTDSDSIRFNGVAGTTYRLQTHLEPQGGMTLTGPSGSVVARHSGQLDLSISFTAASSGVYTLYVSHDAPVGYGGDYVLKIAATSITVNDSVVGTTFGTFAYSGTWATSTGAGKYLGNDHYSSTTASSYSLRFFGTKLALYGAKASHHGQASVQVDGASAVTIDQYAATRTDNVQIYQSPVLSRAAHSVKVTVNGTHQAASTGNVITIDRAVATW